MENVGSFFVGGYSWQFLWPEFRRYLQVFGTRDRDVMARTVEFQWHEAGMSALLTERFIAA